MNMTWSRRRAIGALDYLELRPQGARLNSPEG